MSRPLVGIGHNMGGQNIVQLALLHPRLFSTVICIEPTIHKASSKMNFAPVYFLSNRRDVWPSRDVALAETNSIPMLKGWDSRLVERWKQFGFRDLPTLLHPQVTEDMMLKALDNDKAVPVTLATTKHHEVSAYARPAYPSPGQPLSSFQPECRTHIDLTKELHEIVQAPLYRPEIDFTFHQLPLLRPSCLYIYGAKSTFASALPQGRADKLSTTGTSVGGSGGVEAGKAAEVVVPDGEHLLPFQKPSAVTEHVGLWLETVLAEWKEEDQSDRVRWAEVGVRERAMLDDEWMFWMKEHYGRKGISKKNVQKRKRLEAKL